MAYRVILWDRQLGPPTWRVRVILRDDSTGKDINGPDVFQWDHKPSAAELNAACRDWVIIYLKGIYPWQNYHDREVEALDLIQQIVARFVGWNVATASTITTRGTQLYNAIKNSTDTLQTAENSAAITYRDNFLAQTTIDLSWD